MYEPTTVEIDRNYGEGTYRSQYITSQHAKRSAPDPLFTQVPRRGFLGTSP
jgi:hypothetical protein